MRRTPVALVALAVPLVLAACVGDREGAPLSGPASRSIGAAPPAPTCSFSTLTKDAGTFFSDKKDSVFVIINDFQSIYTKSGAAAATPRGLDVLREVAATRLTTRQITGSDGAPLVVDVFLCTNLESIDLTSASSALGAGIFEIRGGGLGEPPALNEPATSTPRWGVEPRFSLDWPTSQPSLTPAQPRYLVFGYPTSASTLGLSPSDGFTGFEVATRSSVGTTVDKSQLRVGACILAGEGTSANRLIHLGVIIPNESPTFCNNLGAAGAKSTTWLASLANGITSLIAPKPLYAKTTLLDFDFTGGGMGGWSPMGFGAIPVSSVALSFDKQPFNSVASNDGTNDFVVVRATIGAAKNPVPDVTITLSIAGNNGSPANAILYPQVPTPPQGVTGADGTVKIFFSAGKAGGYTITASGSLESNGTQSIISKLFNIKNP